MCRVLGSDKQEIQLHANVKISNDKILNRLHKSTRTKFLPLPIGVGGVPSDFGHGRTRQSTAKDDMEDELGE